MNQLVYQTHRKLRKEKITMQEWWEFIATQDADEVRRIVMHSSSAENRLRKYKDSYRFRNKI